MSFNGISHSPDQRRLVVADMKQVVVFDIEGPGKLSRRQVVPTAHVTDNIEVRQDNQAGRQAER